MSTFTTLRKNTAIKKGENGSQQKLERILVFWEYCILWKECFFFILEPGWKREDAAQAFLNTKSQIPCGCTEFVTRNVCSTEVPQNRRRGYPSTSGVVLLNIKPPSLYGLTLYHRMRFLLEGERGNIPKQWKREKCSFSFEKSLSRTTEGPNGFGRSLLAAATNKVTRCDYLHHSH